MEDFRDAEAGLLHEPADGDELVVVFPLLGPVDADEGLADGRFDADDGAAGRSALDRFERDGNGGIDFEKLPGGGKNRFCWHGRGEARG